MKKTSKFLLTIAFSLMLVVFGKLYIDILFEFFTHQSVLSFVERLVCLVISIVLLTGIYILIHRFEGRIKRFEWLILLIFVIFMFAVQMILGQELRYIPTYDLFSVYDGATQWLVEGSFYRHYEYFYYYPNNLGELSFLTFFFGISARLGNNDFFLVGMLVNALLCAILISSTFVVCRKIFSTSEAIFSLVLYAVCPPFYLMIPVFYTDQLTMAFPVLVVMLFLFYEEVECSILKNEAWAFLITIIAFIGYYLKPTVFIAMIAIFITLLLKGKWKKFLFLLANTLVIFISLTIASNTYFYNHHLDKEVARKQNTPIEVWIYMGLNEEFGYSFEDTLFAREIEDPKERKEIIREKILERIKDYGVVGMYHHLKDKIVPVYSDGTFELSYTYIQGFVKDTPWKEILTQMGSKYGEFWKVCAYHWYSLQFFALIAYLMICKKMFGKKVKDVNMQQIYQVFPIAVSLLGLFLFLLIWEVHYRYIVNYYGFCLIMAVSGLYYLVKPYFTNKK